MNIHCLVDIAESIRRGVNTSGSVILVVDVSALPQPERDELARCIRSTEAYDGMFRPANVDDVVVIKKLPEPNLSSLREVLQKNAAAIEELNAVKLAEKEKDEKQRRDALESFLAQFDSDPKSCCTGARGQLSLNPPALVSATDVLEDPQRRAVFQELRDAFEAEYEVVVAQEQARIQHEAEQNAIEKEELRMWAISNGDELLRLRADSEINWFEMATLQYTATVLRSVGVFDELATDLDGYSYDHCTDNENPTVADLQAARRLHEGCSRMTKVKMWDVTSTVAVYTPDDPSQAGYRRFIETRVRVLLTCGVWEVLRYRVREVEAGSVV